VYNNTCQTIEAIGFAGDIEQSGRLALVADAERLRAGHTVRING